jgi:hypothetical protein
MLNLGTALHNFSDNFVSRDEGKFWVRQFTIHHMKVGPADSAGHYPHQHLSGTRKWCGHFAFAKGGPRCFEDHRAHRISFNLTDLAQTCRIVFSLVDADQKPGNANPPSYPIKAN